MNLELLKQKAILKKNIIKIEISKDEIIAKHPNRTDLINSMQESQTELEDVYAFIHEMEKQLRMQVETSYRLERLNLELKYEVKQAELNLKMYEM